MRDLLLIQERMKSSRYGLLTELALFVECLARARIALNALYAWSNSSKNAIHTPKLQRLVHCCSYVQMHVVLRKKKEYAA